jgi:hypothetical protein
MFERLGTRRILPGNRRVEVRVSGPGVWIGADETDVHIAFDVAPLFGSAERGQQGFERRRVRRDVLEPGEKIERLREVSTMIQPPGDRGQRPRADRDRRGAFLEDLSALILGEGPPGGILGDRNRGGVERVGSSSFHFFTTGKDHYVN